MAKKKSKRELRKRSREIKKARRAELRGDKMTFGEDVKLFRSQLGGAIGGYDYHVVALVTILSIFGVILIPAIEIHLWAL